MLDIIKASLEASQPEARAIAEGAEFLEAIFGPEYPIADLCGALDYGPKDGEKSAAIRELQYAQIIGALAHHYGIDFNEYLIECCKLEHMRSFIFEGKLDAFIYQGQ